MPLGIVKSSTTQYAFIKSDRVAYFCHWSHIPPDEVGRRFLLVGEQVEFEVGERGRSKNPVAMKAKLLSPREPVDIVTYEEDGQVRGVSRAYCFIDRPNGGTVMLHHEEAKQFITTWEKGVRLYVGQWWRYRIAPPRGDGDLLRPWRAVDAIELEPLASEEPQAA